MKQSILIIDDEEALLNLMAIRFEEEGRYNIFKALTAEEGLEILASNRIHIIITDLNLPGMSGVDFCKKVRETNPISIIIAVTGYYKMFELTECRAVGFDDYFKKPISFEDLFIAVDHACGRVQRWFEKD